MQNTLSTIKNDSLLEKAGTVLCSSLLEKCAKFKVDRFSRFCTRAHHVLTTQKRFPSKIPLTRKTATSNSL